VGFSEGIRRTIDWYREHQEWLTRLGAHYVVLP
jgi:hypothetical protein